MHDIQLRLAREEEAEISRGRFASSELTPSTFLSIGLKLEEEQYVSMLFYTSD